MLRRIPAVKWAFTRLRPVPDSGSIDVTPVTAEAAIAEVVVAEAASTQVAETSTISGRDEAESEARSPQDDSAISIIAESPPAAPTDAVTSDEVSRETPSDVEPVVAEEVPAAEIETAIVTPSEPAISSGPAAEASTEVELSDAMPVAIDEPADAAEAVIDNDPFPIEAKAIVTVETSPSAVDVEPDPLGANALIVDDNRPPGVVVDVEPILDAPCVTSGDAELLVEPASETHFAGDSLPDDAVAIEPAAADIAAPVAAVIAEQNSTDAASVITHIGPALVSPAPEVRSPPKVRARPTEPADRTALIRQRWAESGIRMWNPRLHGTGEATLNIQGSIGLLPPAPGETMPRYDKLEFKMLGGQIVCEGVIVEAPAQASHRSFTRLAEPSKVERSREPTLERQAALA
ncbi:hypothetical protein ACU4GH_03825 [Bradyrhizobium betae]